MKLSPRIFLPLAMVLGAGLFQGGDLMEGVSPAPQQNGALLAEFTGDAGPATNPPQLATALASPVSSAGPPVSSGWAAAWRPARPGAAAVSRKADAAVGDPGKTLPLPLGFLDRLTDSAGKMARFPLPDGTEARGIVTLRKADENGVLWVQGRLHQPIAGAFFFQRQTQPGVAGALVGYVLPDHGTLAWRVDPTGPAASPVLNVVTVDQVICVGQPLPPPGTSEAPPAAASDLEAAAPRAREGHPQEAPQAHPMDMPLPAVLNGVVPLESLPGAAGVIYLDFDGEPGPFAGWPAVTGDAAPSGANNGQIKEVWQRVAEDYQAFNLNVTTDRRVFDAAAETSRQHVVITPTSTAAPSSGGIAFIGSFNWSGDTVCWSFLRTGKYAAEAIAHEVGHTLGLSHDGRVNPAEEYYSGQGSGAVGWAPVMGAGYSKTLTQWSRGEYASANNKEDDLAIITNRNNRVDYRADDTPGDYATARYLDILPDFSVANEGIIETRTDVDAWRFQSAGGDVSLTVNPVIAGADLDVLAEIVTSAGDLVASANPDNALFATVTANLPAGDYVLRISGTGRGDPLTTGYSDYGSIGAYLISGTIGNGVRHDRFTLVENTPAGTLVGRIAPRQGHGTNPLAFTILSGNTGGAFVINAATGQLSVANAAALNYENLSTWWDDPARFEIFVAVTDPTVPALNESLRVVVTILPVNEPPVLSGGNLTLFTRTRPGTPVLRVVGSDPDRYDFVRFSIAAGNQGGAFAIDPVSGQLTTTASFPSVMPPGPWNLIVRATDQGRPPLSADTVIPVTVLESHAGFAPGGVLQSWFENIPGTALANLTGSAKYANNTPDSEAVLGAFDFAGHGTDYGSRSRAWLLPPVTGSYTFWIAADDTAELRIGSGAAPASAVLRASVPAATGRYQYDRYPSQTSVSLMLAAGQRYYLEALQKQGSGGDHLSVAWQGPGFTRQVISGAWLVPFMQNRPPAIPSRNFTVRRGSEVGTVLGTLVALDPDPGDLAGSWKITGGTAAAWCALDANTGIIYIKDRAGLDAAPASATLMVEVADDAPAFLSGTAVITLNVLEASGPGINPNAAPVWASGNDHFQIGQTAPAGTLVGTVAATDADNGPLVYSITGGNPAGAFAINPFTGNISVAHSLAPVSQDYALGVRVQDNGVGGTLPVAAALTTVLISVVPQFHLVQPASRMVNLAAGQGLLLTASPSGRPGAHVLWESLSGPGTVTFDQAADFATAARFPSPGVYKILATETASGIPLSFDLMVNAGAAPGLPGGQWVGEPSSLASHRWVAGLWQIQSGGGGLWLGASDRFYFINQAAGGDVTITARVKSVVSPGGPNPDAAAGVMIRESLAVDAPFIFCGLTPLNGRRVISRTTAGLAAVTTGAENLPASLRQATWVRLIRTRSAFSAFSAPDVSGHPGPFLPLGPPMTFPMAEASLAGLAASNGLPAGGGTSEIDNLSLTPSLVNLAPVVTIEATGPASPGEGLPLHSVITDDGRPLAPGSVAASWSKGSGTGGVVFSLPDQADTSATFSQPGSYRLRLSADDGEVTTFRELAVSANGFPIDYWRAARFGSQAGVPDLAGDLADPDRDGLPNLLEYALGRDPLLPDAPGFSAETAEFAGSRYLRLTIARNPAASDISGSVEASLSPGAAGSWNTSGTVVELDTPETLRVRTSRTLDEAPFQFLRFRVTR